jgi:hypothetical protein
MDNKRRIAQFNLLLNAAVSHKHRHDAAHKEAYKRLLQSIEKAITEEQSIDKLTKERISREESAEKAKKITQRKLHEELQQDLKKQVKEKQVLKSVEKARKRQPHISNEFQGYPHHPQEPLAEVRRKKKAQQEELKKGLYSQIEEKTKQIRRQAQQTDIVDKLRVDIAKASLDQEKLLRADKQQTDMKALTDAWRQDLELREIDKNTRLLSKLVNKSTYAREYQWTTPGDAVQELPTQENQIQETAEVADPLEEGTHDKDEAKQTAKEQVRQDGDEEAKVRPEGLELTRELLDYLKKRSTSLAASKAPSEKSKSSSRSARSKSIMSTVSRQEAYEKLKELEVQEESIRRQKEELLKDIQSSSRFTSARMTTVSSLMSRGGTPGLRTNEVARQVLRQPEEFKLRTPQPGKKRADKPKDEVNQLLRSLFL